MTRSDQNIEELQRQAEARGRQLANSVDQVRFQLRPSSLAHEAAERLRTAAQGEMHNAVEKANSPAGRKAAIAALSLAGLAIAWRVRGRRPIERLPTSSTAVEEPPQIETESQAIRLRPGPLIAATSAVGLGIVLDKVIPPSASEQQLLESFGAEIKLALKQWTQRQVRRFVLEHAHEPLHPANAVTLAAAFLLTSRQERDAAERPQ
jgi:hypothetical protein